MTNTSSTGTFSKAPVRVAVTGASGQIAYALLFRLIAGELLGKDQPVILQLAELPQAMERLQGVALELEDCASPRLAGMVLTSDNREAFKDADIVIMLGAKPRGPGMERKDLLLENGKSFAEQGAILNEVASRDVKVLVVGNPANTNAMTACRCAPDLDDSQFSALTRLDHNRLQAQIALKLNCNPSDLSKLAIWGNHSSTMVPDIHHAKLNGEQAVAEKIDEKLFQEEILPTVQQRGAAIIKARGLSSAASASQAIIDHLRDWIFGTPADNYVSMAIISEGQYGITPGLCFSYPVQCKDGKWQIVEGLEFSELGKKMLAETEKELLEEQHLINTLLD